MDIQKNIKKHDAVRTVTTNEIGFDAHDIVESIPVGISTWVRSLLQNWRQGTVGVKDRSEVARSNKKPWKQKGTGRARAGTARSPLWRGGGVIFGPQPRVKELTVSKKIKSKALCYLMHQFLINDKVMSLDWQIEGANPSAAQASKCIKSINLHNTKLLLFVPTDDFVTYASFANIPYVKILFFDQVNAFDLMNAEYLLVLDKDINSFKEMVLRWWN